MLTKTQFCKAFINQYASKNKIKVEDVSESEIHRSSCLAVVLEHLGLITDPELKNYVSQRAGTLYIFTDENNQPHFLTIRELISLLPED